MSRPKYPSDEQDQFMIRFPSGMREELKSAAAANNRSMNAEIVARLSGGGKTLRDEFAMAALTGFLAGDEGLGISLRRRHACRSRGQAMNALSTFTEQADGRACIEQRLDVLTDALSRPLPAGQRRVLLREYNNLCDEIMRLSQ